MAAHVSEPIAPDTDGVVLQRDIVDQLLRIESTSGGGFLRPLLDQFFGEKADRLDKLRRALATGDVETLAEAAHNLKGSAGSLGAYRLGQLGAGLELLVRRGDLGGADRWIDRIEAEHGVAETAFNRLLDSLGLSRQVAAV